MLSEKANLVTARLPGLDVLRAFAALWVLIFHYMALAPEQLKPGLESFYISIGWNGVDLFFVLSGFLIGGILCRESESVRSFMIRRFFRIYPAFLLMVFLGITLVKPYLADNWLLITSHLLMFNNLIPGYGGAINGVLWTLGAEFQFYVLAGLILFSPRGRYFWFILIAIMMIGSGLYRWIVFEEVAPAKRFFLTTQLPGMLGLFAMGFLVVQLKFLIGDFVRRHFLIFLSLALLSVFLFCKWLQPVLGGYWDIKDAVVFGRFYSGLAFAFLVLVFACTPAWLDNLFSRSGLVFIGEISYGIYLTHLFFMELFRPYEGFFMQYGWPLYAGALLGATLLASCLIYFLVERPFIRLGARLASGHGRALGTGVVQAGAGTATAPPELRQETGRPAL